MQPDAEEAISEEGREMKTAIAWTLALIFLSGALYAQEPEKKKEEIIAAGAIYIKGVRYWVSKSDKYLIATTARRQGKYFVVLIGVRNDSDTAVTFDPSQMRVESLLGDPALRYFSPDEVAKKIKSRSKWGILLRSVAAGMESFGNQQTTTTRHSGTVTAHDNYGNFAYGSYSGTSTTTTQRSNAEIQRRQRRDLQAIRNTASYRAAKLKANAAYIHTIMPGAFIVGDVYFSAVKQRSLKKYGLKKKGFLSVVYVPLGEETFKVAFPFRVVEEIGNIIINARKETK